MVNDFEVLIGKAFSIDATATSSVSLCEVTTLDHEVVDDTMEDAAFVTAILSH